MCSLLEQENSFKFIFPVSSNIKAQVLSKLNFIQKKRRVVSKFSKRLENESFNIFILSNDVKILKCKTADSQTSLNEFVPMLESSGKFLSFYYLF